MSAPAKHFYDFDHFRLDPAERVLLRDGEMLSLTQKAFDVLLVLIERRGQTVSKDELMQRVWPDTFVEESNLSQNIYTLRKVLGQTGDGQEFIKTIPKRGYRFMADVRETRAEEPPPKIAAAPVLISQERITVPLDLREEVQAATEEDSAAGSLPAEAAPVKVQQIIPAEPTNPTPTSINRRGLVGWSAQHKWLTAGLIILLLLAAGIILWPRGASDFAASDSAGRMTITSLTNTGNIACAALSPDGKYVAYGVNDNPQRSSLWLMQTATLTSQQIVAPAEVQYHALTFTPDGQFIYYVARQNNALRTLYRVPLLGGPSRKLIEKVDSAVSFAPDSARFVYRTSADERRAAVLMIANADGTGARELAASKYPDPFRDPAWSPDGQEIACAIGNSEGRADMRVVAVRVADGTMRPITTQRWHWIGQMAWLPNGRGLMMVAGEQPAAPFQIWRLDSTSGAAERVTNDANFYNRLSLAPAARTLIALQRRQVTNVWLLPRAQPERAQQITFGAGGYRGQLAWTPDGKLVYDSETGNTASLSMMNADGSQQRSLTSDPANRAYVGHATVSPDNRYIVFSSDLGGVRHIWRMNIDGSNHVQITNGAGEDEPSCTPDNRWVVYTRLERAGAPHPTIWRVSMDGGEAKQLTTAFTTAPAVSPDGKLLACWQSAPGELGRLAVYPIEGGQPVKIFPQQLNSSPARWTPDGSGLTYADNPIGPAQLWVQPLVGGAPQLLAEFASDRIFGFDWSPDGRQLACVRGLWAMNVVLLKDFN